MPASKALLATAAATVLLLAAGAAGDTCYRADQQVNIRAKADICSSSKGSIEQGDVIRVTGGSPQRTCYNWAEAEVVSGGLDGAQGYVNLDAMTETTCLGTPARPLPNAPCKNAGDQCLQDNECCQPGSGPAARCQAPDNRGSPKVCSGGAVVTSAVPTGVAVPSAADSGGR